MPGKVKVKIISGRNLPVMDRSNDTTDAFVEVKLGNVTCKTDVCRKSLNPLWDSEWFRFEMDDLELQDEPLQIRLMDYDMYSANDSIGRVYIDLNPLLTNPSKTKEPSGRTMSGWIPVYDTMHGIRGEVNLTVKVELFSDLNKFRQSSCGVKFFFSQSIPEGHLALQLHGFVEELVVNDDPEYQWIDKIRTPRASNEARQTLFSKLSGEVQRRVGLKALELGGNAVIGYRQCFDLEGESGIVVRGIGTASTLAKIHDVQISPMPVDPGSFKECQSKDRQPATVSFPKPSSHPNFTQKPSSSEMTYNSKSPVSHSSMPESVLRNFCGDNNSSSAFDVHRLPDHPIPVSELVNIPCAGTYPKTPTPTSGSPLTLKDIKLGKDSPVPFITSPVEVESEVPESSHGKHEICVTPDSDNGPSRNPGARDEFTDLVLRASESLKKGLTFIGSHGEKSSQVQRQRSRGSKKKDKYSTSSLVKRVNASFPDKPTSFTHSKDKIKGEVLKFFSKKWWSHPERRSPDMDETDDIEGAPSPGYMRTYREPKFKRDFLFFRKKKRRSSCGSSRHSHLRRSLSDSLSIDRNSLESLPSIQSEDLSYQPDWVPIPVSIRMNSIKDPPTRPKVFDPKTVIPESSQPSLSISSHSSEQAGNPGFNSHNNDIIQVIRELGYNHSSEKPLKLYISSLDALLVYEPVKNVKEISERARHSSCHDSWPNSECRSNANPACSLDSKISNKNNMRDTSSQFGVTTSLSHNEFEITNLSGNKPTPSPATSYITHTKHANMSNRNASEVIESMKIPHIISCTAPLNTPTSGVGNSVVMLGDPTSTVRNPSSSQGWIPDTIPEDPKQANGYGKGDGPHHSVENGTSHHGQVSGKICHSSGASLVTSTSSVSSTSAIPGQVALTQILESSNNKISLICSNTSKVVARSTATAIASFSGRRSSESDLSTPPKGLLNASIQSMLTSSHGKGTSYAQSRGKAPQTDHFDMLEYPFITISMLPPRLLTRIGGAVCARSVKLLERISNLDEPESRDSWWTELRMEIRSHARYMCCNVILGYEEHTSICDDVCILTATGTAVVVNAAALGDMTSAEVSNSNSNPNKPHLAPVPEARAKGSKEPRTQTSARTETAAPQQNGTKNTAQSQPSNTKTTTTKETPPDEPELNCKLCHVPYEDFSVPFPVKMSRCGICKKGKVPDLLLATVEIPPNIPICGKICLIQAQICRPKKDGKGEAIAKEVSDSLPFIEYELHRRLINKLKVKGMNAIFCLKVQICLGERMIVGVATGTAMCLAGLRPLDLPKIIAGDCKTDTQKVVQFQKVVSDAHERNKKFYMLNTGPFAKFQNGASQEAQDAEEESEEDLGPPLNLAIGNKDTYVLEVDDTEDIEIISEIVDPGLATGCEMNTMDIILDYDDVAIVSQQMFTQVWRGRIPNLTLRQLGSQFDRILRALTFKLRNVQPCVVNKLRFHLELPDDDEIQLSITGTAFGLTKKGSNLGQLSPLPPSTTVQQKATPAPVEEGMEMIFNLECETSNGKDIARPSSLSSPAPLPLISTNVVSPSSPSLPTSSSIKINSTKTPKSDLSPSTTVDMIKTSNEPSTSSTPISNVTQPINLNSTSSIDPSSVGLPQCSATTSTSPVRQFRLSASPHHGISRSPISGPITVPPLWKPSFKSSATGRAAYLIEMTTLSQIPGYHIDKYLGNLNFFFIRETTSIKEMGGPTGFLHSLLVEVMTVLRAHVAALGGNALVSYFLNELSLLHNPHKNQGQCLINVGGDAVLVVPINQEENFDPPRTNP